MKKIIRLLVVMLVAAVIFPAAALADSNAGGSVTLDTDIIPGTLQARVEALADISSAADVVELHITAGGELNDVDIAYINTLTNMEVLNVASTVAVGDAGDNFLRGIEDGDGGAIREVTFPATAFGNFALAYCYNLTSINLPNVVTLGNSALIECTAITDVYLPETITIGQSFLNNAQSVVSINIPKVTSIGDYSIAHCYNLTTVNLPKVVTLGMSAFEDAHILESINLPEAKTFSYYAFVECDKLTEVILPKAETFGGSAFFSCDILTNISLPKATAFDRSAFSSCRQLASVSLPKATTFGDYAFSGCSNLINITLPEALTFGRRAFDNCTGLKSLTLPKATSFGADALYRTYALKSLTLGATPPTVESFSTALASTRYVHIPKGTDDTYDMADSTSDEKWFGWIINTPPNRKSAVDATATAQTTIDVDYTLDLTEIFEDYDSDPLTYKVNVDGAGYVVANASYSYSPTALGEVELVFIANDTRIDSTDTYTVTLTVVNTAPNRKSTVNATATAQTTSDVDYTLDLTEIFEDADGDGLNYKVNIDGAGYTPADVSYSYSPTALGDVELVFIANDGTDDSTDTYTVALTVINTIPNRKSTVAAEDTATIEVGEEYQVDLSTIFEDIDGDAITYEADVDGGGYGTASTVFTYVDISAGEIIIIFRAKDATDYSTDTYKVTLTIVNGNHTITYDANGGSGTDSETHTGTTIFSLHDGMGFAQAYKVIDGWTIEGVDYMLGQKYEMPNAEVTAFAIWADDTDSDGVSDDDETDAGTDPEDPADTPERGTITVTVLNVDGTPVSGYECVLNSTPVREVTGADGAVSFTNVILANHTLTLLNGNDELGTYTLTFAQDTDDTTVISDDASTDSIGIVNTTVTNKFLYLDVTIQHNPSNFWQLAGSSVVTEADPIINPRTGDDSMSISWMWMLILLPLLSLGGLAVRRKMKQN